MDLTSRKTPAGKVVVRKDDPSGGMEVVDAGVGIRGGVVSSKPERGPVAEVDATPGRSVAAVPATAGVAAKTVEVTKITEVEGRGHIATVGGVDIEPSKVVVTSKMAVRTDMGLQAVMATSAESERSGSRQLERNNPAVVEGAETDSEIEVVDVTRSVGPRPSSARVPRGHVRDTASSGADSAVVIPPKRKRTASRSIGPQRGKAARSAVITRSRSRKSK